MECRPLAKYAHQINDTAVGVDCRLNDGKPQAAAAFL